MWNTLRLVSSRWVRWKSFLWCVQEDHSKHLYEKSFFEVQVLGFAITFKGCTWLSFVWAIPVKTLGWSLNWTGPLLEVPASSPKPCSASVTDWWWLGGLQGRSCLACSILWGWTSCAPLWNQQSALRTLLCKYKWVRGHNLPVGNGQIVSTIWLAFYQ